MHFAPPSQPHATIAAPKTMAKSPPLSRLLLSIFFISTFIIATNAGDLHNLRWVPSKSTCHGGTIAECQPADEFAMDSEINRRMLATSDYISYQALKRDSVPCSRSGASYYNCQAGAEANPYNRGCSTITQCRS